MLGKLFHSLGFAKHIHFQLHVMRMYVSIDIAKLSPRSFIQTFRHLLLPLSCEVEEVNGLLILKGVVKKNKSRLFLFVQSIPLYYYFIAKSQALRCPGPLLLQAESEW